MELLHLLTRRALLASNISAPAVFGAVDRWQPTLILDEADTFLPENEELRGVLNSGYSRRSAVVVRTVGDEHEPKAFSTWCPKAISGIGKLPHTLEDRSIVLPLKRKLRSEKVERLRHADEGEFKEVAPPIKTEFCGG